MCDLIQETGSLEVLSHVVSGNGDFAVAGLHLAVRGKIPNGRCETKGWLDLLSRFCARNRHGCLEAAIPSQRDELRTSVGNSGPLAFTVVTPATAHFWGIGLPQTKTVHFNPWTTPAATAATIEVRLLDVELSFRPDMNVPAAH